MMAVFVTQTRQACKLDGSKNDNRIVLCDFVGTRCNNQNSVCAAYCEDKRKRVSTQQVQVLKKNDCWICELAIAFMSLLL